jgi:hypothetical protein
VDGSAAPTGNCSSGWFCTGGSSLAQPTGGDIATSIPGCGCLDANYTGGQCWPGTYCPSGSPYPIDCDGGMYCAGFGLDSPTGLCDAGYYCDKNASQPNPSTHVCPPGAYCDVGSASPTPCPPGTMADVFGARNLSYCELCTAGYYCEGPGNTNYTGPCAVGYYCPAGQDQATPAEFNCTVGHYCPGGTGLPVPCPFGMYQDQLLQGTCQDCPPGR